MNDNTKHTSQEIQALNDWFQSMQWKALPFQVQGWKAYHKGDNGIVNAPTGSGKTYSLLLPALQQANASTKKGIKVIWITPIRALAKEIKLSAERAIQGLSLGLSVGIRNGDTSTTARQKQDKSPPDLLITTPESLHLLFARKGFAKRFKGLQAVIVDEWHELLGSKRGVQMELALALLRHRIQGFSVWGISATIGNMEIALSVLLGDGANKGQLIRADIHKSIEVKTIIPSDVASLPLAGHLGVHQVEAVAKIIHGSQSTLVFTNTRNQCEMWYQKLIDFDPNLIGLIAMHHGSLDKELRSWVEGGLYEGKLKVVVCTSSLDLGVDFRPVESIIQIGGPKGVSRFMQRAGRSGHSPGATSTIYFVPTHAIEMIEGSALRQAIAEQSLESRLPFIQSFDVLVQFLVTLAVGDGFFPTEVYQAIVKTHCYAQIEEKEWRWCLRFICDGGGSLQEYPDFRKVEIDDDGRYIVKSRRIAMRHRLSMGTIVSDPVLWVRFKGGRNIGTVEEYFISGIKEGDVFWFAGRPLQLVSIHDNTVFVKNTKRKTGKIPAWAGGRMPLSSQMSTMLLRKLHEAANQDLFTDEELIQMKPIFDHQRKYSMIPKENELLIEYFEDREGLHILCYPFEGRNVHEGMAGIIAHRIAQIRPITFSIGMNDYGFELLTDQSLDVESIFSQELFAPEEVHEALNTTMNASQMTRRQFRDIAAIAGLVFTGFPGKPKKDRHIQATSQLFYNVFETYEPSNLLFRQALHEVMERKLEEGRLRDTLERIQSMDICMVNTCKPSPFALPLLAERIREKFSTESVEDRIRRMELEILKG